MRITGWNVLSGTEHCLRTISSCLPYGRQYEEAYIKREKYFIKKRSEGNCLNYNF